MGLLVTTGATLGAQVLKPWKPVRAILPLAPFEPAWTVDLPDPPSGSPTVDAGHVFVPLESAVLVALDRRTGLLSWSAPLLTRFEAVVHGDRLFVAALNTVRAVSTVDGGTVWETPLAAEPVLPPMVVPGAVLVTTAGHEVLCLDGATGAVRWRKAISDASAPAGLVADDTTGFLVLRHGVVHAFDLERGERLWERFVPGPLSAPSIGRQRVVVGSEDNAAYAINSANGRLEWRLLTGGDIVGTAVDVDTIFITSRDNVLRAVRRTNGNQIWKQPIPTRPSGPPIALPGLVAQPGNRPALSTYSAWNGDPQATYEAPSELLGLLVDRRPSPRQVSAVAVTREGQVIGLRSTELMLREPAPTPWTSLPGRVLGREPDAPPAASPVPARGGVTPRSSLPRR